MKLHDFVICNPELCIGCKACMKACVKEATKRGKIAIARCEAYKDVGGGGGNFSAQCRQCDDAPCAVVCPTSALRNEKGYVELFERLCIGCGLCTVACPYGAIRLESEEIPSTKQSLADICEDGFASVAVKCDICDGKEGGGSACVEACPKGALAILRPSSGEHIFGKKLKNTDSMSAFIGTILQCDAPKIDLTPKEAKTEAAKAQNAAEAASEAATKNATAADKTAETEKSNSNLTNSHEASEKQTAASDKLAKLMQKENKTAETAKTENQTETPNDKQKAANDKLSKLMQKANKTAEAIKTENQAQTAKAEAATANATAAEKTAKAETEKSNSNLTNSAESGERQSAANDKQKAASDKLAKLMQKANKSEKPKKGGEDD